MGGMSRAKCRFGSQIKNYMVISQYMTHHQPANAVVARSSLDLVSRKPSPGDKPRNPAAHKWRHTGEAKGRIFRDIDPVPFNRVVDVPYGVCFNCWQYDHQQGNCPKPIIDDHCQNCGRIGVKVSNCPRCRRAYQVYRKKNKVQPAIDAECRVVKKKDNKEKAVEKSQEQEVSPVQSSSPDHHLSYNEHFCREEDPSYDEFDDYTTIIVDERMSVVITSDFLDRFSNFIDAIQYLPAKDKVELTQSYISEHRKQLRKNEK